MKRERIMARLRRAAEERLICNVYLKGKDDYVNGWQTLFATLPSDQLTGVERLHAPDDEARFIVGRIIKAGKSACTCCM